MNTSNRLLGGFTFAAGAAVWLAAGGIQTPPDTHTLSAQFFPKLLAVALALFGGLLFIQGGGLPLGAVFEKIRSRRNWGLAACTLLFTAAFGHVDYRLICPAYLAVTLWILGRRRVRDIAIISLTSTAVLYLLFRYGFMVMLPEMEGIWN